jgi:hypothetical protein
VILCALFESKRRVTYVPGWNHVTHTAAVTPLVISAAKKFTA